MTHRLHPSSYLLVAPLETFPERERFGTVHHPFPGHVTIVPPFIVPLNRLRHVMTAIDGYCGLTPPIDVEFTDRTGFDDDPNAPVRQVAAGRDRLITLHRGMCVMIRGGGGEIIDKSYADEGGGYQPHTSAKLEINDAFVLDTLHLVGRYTKGHGLSHEKNISATYKLGQSVFGLGPSRDL